MKYVNSVQNLSVMLIKKAIIQARMHKLSKVKLGEYYVRAERNMLHGVQGH